MTITAPPGGLGSWRSFSTGPGYQLHRGDALEAYEDWPAPVLIISDGPYGPGSFPGEVAEVGNGPMYMNHTSKPGHLRLVRTPLCGSGAAKRGGLVCIRY